MLMIYNVAYSVELDEEEMKKVLNEAESQGLDYADAGKVETVTRFLIQNGIEGLSSLSGLEGFNNYKRGI